MRTIRVRQVSRLAVTMWLLTFVFNKKKEIMNNKLTFRELRKVVGMWKENKPKALIYCKLRGYKLLTQKLQQKL